LQSTLKKQLEESESDNKWLVQKETDLAVHKRVSTASSTGSGGFDELKKDTPNVVVKVMEPSPTAELDRQNDDVYNNTTKVVKSVISMNQGIQQDQVDFVFEYVLGIGKNLKELLLSVDKTVLTLPETSQKGVS
jgi:focal adhesion kinase 1